MEIDDDTSPIRAGNGKAMKGKVRLLSRQQLDGRTKAAKTFDRIANGIASDLGGKSRLSVVQSELVLAFAGIAVHVHSLNTAMLASHHLGQDIQARKQICEDTVRAGRTRCPRATATHSKARSVALDRAGLEAASPQHAGNRTRQ